MSATQERERLVLPKDYTFDLADEMVERLKNEFYPNDTVAELAPKVAGKAPAEAQRIAEEHFRDYGRRLMDRSVELGNQYRDRAYETLLTAAAKTGEMGFPFIPERFVEIAYLSTQPIYSLPITENTKNVFGYKMVFCDTIEALRDQCGDALADGLPCREGCLAAAERAFTANGFDVEVSQDASVIGGDFCQFSVRRKGAQG
jgi:hypothetical protein